jgi:DNA-binding response OmpR family regulator
MTDEPIILLVEDSPSQACQIQLWLVHLPLIIIHADNGAKGWEQARVGTPSLILLDMHLPIINGLQLLLLLKATPHTATIPTLMLSGADSFKDVDTALAIGADGYLFKDDYFGRPGAGARLLEAIGELLPTFAGEARYAY